MLACKGTFSRPGIPNMISRIPELQTCIAFVLAWTQLGIEYIAQRNFIPRGSRELHIFWREDGPYFLHGFLHLIPHILHRVHIEPLCWPINEFNTHLQWPPFFKHMCIINGGAVFFNLDYSNSIKQSYTQNHFILQNLLIPKADQVLFILHNEGL